MGICGWCSRTRRYDPRTHTQGRARSQSSTSRQSVSVSSQSFWTCKDLLTLERHGARTFAGVRERVVQRLLTLAAAISLKQPEVLVGPAAAEQDGM